MRKLRWIVYQVEFHGCSSTGPALHVFKRCKKEREAAEVARQINDDGEPAYVASLEPRHRTGFKWYKTAGRLFRAKFYSGVEPR